MIELRDIRKVYQTKSESVEAVKGISIAFRDHEFVSILGPSGGGKTTTLNIIGGLDHPTSGELIINGRSTKDFKDRDWDAYRNHEIGFVFQSYNLIPHQTVLGNVELALTLGGVPRSEREKKAIAALDAVGLHDKIHKNPSELSGGQMQRVAIARALVNNPRIILADEPTGALDTKTGEQIMDILKEVSKDHLVVMVTHNPDLAQRYSTRIVSLTDGRITDDTDPFTPASPKAAKPAKLPRTSMKFATAFSLSMKNLWTKKGRTFLTSFAGSIGIIGIALVLSLSTGVNRYIRSVQEDTMSSYPLMIRNQSADLNGIVNSIMNIRNSRDEGEGETVSEQKILEDMFARVGTNNLAEFREYMFENAQEVEQDTSAVQYLYDVTPQVYLSDTSQGAVRLNPSSTSDMMEYAGTTQGSAFEEMVSDQSLLEAQFELLDGRWPQKYDEAVLILSSAHTISDYTEYQIGLRDPQEFQEMVRQLIKGEDVSLPTDTRTYTYDDFLELTYQVVPSYQYYQYNEEYGIWEDMSDDEEYVSGLVENGITLKVVAVIAPRSSTQLNYLYPGIGYTEKLVDYLIDQAAASDIVKSQLSDEETDVFTGRLFSEEANDTSNDHNIDFSSIISVDESAIASAIGMGIDRSALEGYVRQSVQDTITDVLQAETDSEKDFKTLFGSTLKGYFHQTLQALTEEEQTAKADLVSGYAAYLQEEESQAQIAAVAEKYNLSAEMMTYFLNQAFSGGMDKYPQDTVPLNPDYDQYVDSVIDQAMSQEYFSSKDLEKITDAMDQALQAEQIARINATLAENTARSVASSLHVDASAIQGAFHLNYDEDQLLRLLNTFTSARDKKYTAEENLTALGYADVEKPSGIDIYFRDFDSKSRFQDFIDEYNDRMIDEGRDSSTITYTDLAATLVESVRQIVDTISYVLIAFVSVSLVVSSIMIGIITYISVLERIKEIGLLRAIGASRRDISHVFNAETFIIGLLSGVIGVGASYLLCVPLTGWLQELSGIPDLSAVLEIRYALMLVAISVGLTLIAGLVPASIASKKDPIQALRTE